MCIIFQNIQSLNQTILQSKSAKIVLRYWLLIALLQQQNVLQCEIARTLT